MPYAHSNSALNDTLKLFPGVCALQILWKFVPDCQTTHAEAAAAKTSRPHAWDDEVSVVADRNRERAATVCRSVHVTKVLRTSAARTVEHHQRDFESQA